MMEITEKLYVKNREAWREWLINHHAARKEIWLVYYKKHTGKSRIPYDHAVEEALCFGWIDSTVKRVDDEIYVQRFTPRKKNSNWSDLNKKRARNLIKSGKMTDAGMILIRDDLWEKEGARPVKAKTEEVPQALTDALAKNPEASATFNFLAPSYRKMYILWISSAKQEITRMKRIDEAIGYLEKGKKLPMK